MGLGPQLVVETTRIGSHDVIVVTGEIDLASAPKVVEEAGRLLEGKKVTKELIEAVSEAAAKVAHPLDNADLDYWYRKRMAKVFTKRALASVSGCEL